MKRLKTALLPVVVAGLAAQPTTAQVMTMALKGGATFATARVEAGGGAVGTDSRNTFHIGAGLGLAFSPTFAVQVEGRVVARGFRLATLNSGLTPGLHATYFDIPIVAVFNPLGAEPDQTVTPRLFVGPMLALRISCTPVDVEDAPITGECAVDVARQVDFGITLGGGIKVGRGLGGLTIDVTFNRGFVNINKSPTLDASIKNQDVMLTVGYLFAII
ncbi:MAG: outer membrane beta-barrel protein [Gemmatimonadetes bacterium]|nr:outer membrane beta-barrel protein [Gemmatimonadota bacterium]